MHDANSSQLLTNELNSWITELGFLKSFVVPRMNPRSGRQLEYRLLMWALKIIISEIQSGNPLKISGTIGMSGQYWTKVVLIQQRKLFIKKNTKIPHFSYLLQGTLLNIIMESYFTGGFLCKRHHWKNIPAKMAWNYFQLNFSFHMSRIFLLK